MSSNLVSLWPAHGKTVLSGMFGLSDEESKASREAAGEA